MGWIILVLIGVVVVFCVFKFNKSSHEPKASPRPYMITAKVNSTRQPKTVERTDLQKISRETQIRRLLEQAIENRIRIKMIYKTENPQQNDFAIKTRDVDLYGVGDDYIDAFCYYRNEVRTFKISRIISVSLSEKKYKIPSFYVESGWVTDGWDEIEND